MRKFLDLDRRFVERLNYKPDELFQASFDGGKQIAWGDLTRNRFSIVVAPANYGKTTELAERAKQLRREGAYALFVALRQVISTENVESALEIPEQAALQSWDLDRSSELTLFVDSLDEAALGRAEDLSIGLQRLGKWIDWPISNIRWVISTRPAVLTPRVFDVLNTFASTRNRNVQQELPELDEETSPAGDELRSAVVEVERERVHIFSMVPLNARRAERYLQDRWELHAPGELIGAARRVGLSSLTSSPGSLDVLSNIELVKRPPESLSEAMARVVDTMRQLHREPRTSLVGAPSPALLLTATEKLACASTLCERVNIELPQDLLDESDEVLSARRVISGDLSDKAINYLLGSELFIDAGHQQVKGYPDEIQPFLAARRLAQLVNSPEQAHALLSFLSWGAPTGEKGVFRQFLPVCGWLATMNQHFANALVEVDPQAVAFFGDLRNLNLQGSIAQRALRDAIANIADHRDFLGRQNFILTTENYWQAGAPRLESIIRELFESYKGDPGVRKIILDIARSARSAVLRDAVLAVHQGDFKQLVKTADDVRYVAELESQVDLQAIADALATASDPNDDIVARVLPALCWRFWNAEHICLMALRPLLSGRPAFRLRHAVEDEVVRLATDEELSQLATRLIRRLLKTRRLHNFDVISNVLELALSVLCAFVKRAKAEDAPLAGSLCYLAQSFVMEKNYGASELGDLRKAIGENASVRKSYLSVLLKRAHGRADNLNSLLFGYGNIYSPAEDDLRMAEFSDVAELVKQHRTQSAESNKPNPAQGKRDARRKIPSLPKAKAQLSAQLVELADATAVPALHWAAKWMVSSMRADRYGEGDFTLLEEHFGSEVANAVAKGLRRLWKEHAPIYNESAPLSTNYSTIAGLQGLHFELGDGSAIPELTHSEVTRALEYGLFEINGLPKWFWPLVRRYPEFSSESLQACIERASRGPLSKDHASRLIWAMGDAPPEVRNRIAPIAWQFAKVEPQEHDVVDAALDAAASSDKAYSRQEFESVAKATLDQAQTQVQIDTPDAETKLRNSLAWATRWLLQYPAGFVGYINGTLRRTAATANAYLIQVAGHIGERHRNKLIETLKQGREAEEAIFQLYRAITAAVRYEDDQPHAEFEVYNVSARDNAERFRDGLLPLLASAGTQNAYSLLTKLAKQSNTRTPRDVAGEIRWLQFDLQEKRLARPSLRVRDYLKFESELAPPVSDLQSFARAVHSDLLGIKYQIENGEFSLRTFFSTARNFPAASKKHRYAIEADFQQLVGAELERASRGNYAVSLESRLPEATRRDVLVQKLTFRASIELKMSERWSVHDYVAALHSQLVGKYMRARNSKIGFFVVVLQRNRHWRSAQSRAPLVFEDLLALLRNEACRIEAENPDLWIRIVGMNAVDPAIESEGLGGRRRPKSVKVGRKRKAKGARGAPVGANSGRRRVKVRKVATRKGGASRPSLRAGRAADLKRKGIQMSKRKQ